MRRALRVSSNRAAVRMLDIVGIPSVVSQAARLGLGRMPPVPALALGSGEVTLLSMTMAYAAFADQGRLHEPTFIRRVVGRDGRVLSRSRPSGSGAGRHDRLPAGRHAGRRGGRRHRLRRAPDGLHAARRGQDRHDQRPQGRVVPGVHAGACDGCVGGLRSTAHNRPERLRRRSGGAAVDAVHAGRHGRRPAALAPAAARPRAGPGLRRVRSAALPGCLHAPADDGDGVSRPGVRAEYLLEGTRPRQFCGLHPGGTFFSALARAMGFARAPEPVYGQAPEPRVEPTQRASASAPPPPDPSAPGQERGFCRHRQEERTPRAGTTGSPSRRSPALERGEAARPRSRDSLKTTNSSLPGRYSQRRRTLASSEWPLELHCSRPLTNMSGVIA